ncbi:MAG: sugar ABC transporter permease [Clostridia bacterium]|nr:sugar ABC transporter permease [Clostridia bacterium]
MFSDPKFVGLKNFELLFDKTSIYGDAFYAALSNNLIYVCVAAVINFTVGITIAWSIFRPSKLNSTLRTIIYMPSMIISFALSMMMSPIFSSNEFSLINQIRQAMGLDLQNWLGTRGQGVWVLCILCFWGVGGAMMTYISGMKNIDKSVYEAAKLDGAANMRLLVSICLPLLAPMIVYQVIMTFVGGLQAFDNVMGLATICGGNGTANMGTDNSLATLVFYLYNLGFKDFKMGMASALGWITFAITGVFGIALLVFVQKTGYYSIDGD